MSTERPGGGHTSIGDRVQALLAERLAPGQTAAAVFVGVAIGIIPIYGAQSIAAIALATLFRLNRPLTLAATFIGNPFFQPFLVFGALKIGHRVVDGIWVQVSPSALMASSWQSHVWPFVLGSLVLAVLLAVPAAAATYLGFAWQRERRAVPRRGVAGGPASTCPPRPPPPDDRTAARRLRNEVDRRYVGIRSRDRGYVRLKIRLDRLFSLLLEQDLGTGPVVDLGCGHGLALMAAALDDRSRTLHGCDLNARRVAAAQQALAGFDARLFVADISTFEIPAAGLILIVDVLAYFDRAGQAALLARCYAALQPGGRLIFRVPESQPGITRVLTVWLDRALFRGERMRVLPTHLAASDYRELLADLGVTAAEIHARNRLPLSHVLFLARKPGAHADA